MDRTIIVGKDREGWTVKIDVWQEVNGQNKDDSKGKNEQKARFLTARKGRSEIKIDTMQGSEQG